MALSLRSKALWRLSASLLLSLSAPGCVTHVVHGDPVAADALLARGPLGPATDASGHKVCYVLNGDAATPENRVTPMPLKGNETVLDVIATIGTMPCNNDIFIRRLSAEDGNATIQLPVHWLAITRDGNMTTNYKLQAGDEVIIGPDKTTRSERMLHKALEPLENQFSGVKLTKSSVRSLATEN